MKIELGYLAINPKLIILEEIEGVVVFGHNKNETFKFSVIYPNLISYTILHSSLLHTSLQIIIDDCEIMLCQFKEEDLDIALKHLSQYICIEHIDLINNHLQKHSY